MILVSCEDKRQNITVEIKNHLFHSKNKTNKKVQRNVETTIAVSGQGSFVRI